MNWNNNFILRFVLRCSAIIIYEYLRKNTGWVSKIFYPRFIPNIYTSPFPFYAVVFVDNKIRTNFPFSTRFRKNFHTFLLHVQSTRSFLTTWVSKDPRDGDYLFAGTKYWRRKLAISIFVRLFIDRADCLSTENRAGEIQRQIFANRNAETKNLLQCRDPKCIYLASRLSPEIFRIFRNEIRIDLNR